MIARFLLRRSSLALLVGATAVGVPAMASGAMMRHLKVVRSFPKADTVLTSSPDRVSIELSETVEVTGSKILLATSAGAAVALTAPHRETGAPKILRADVTKPLAAGAYAVSWRTMSKDGHVVKGTFQFRVGR